MKTVWKFPINTPERGSIIRIRMPKDAEVLHIDNQNNAPFMWALVDVDDDGGTEYTTMVEREFEVYGTGHPIKDEKYSMVHHLGTFIIRNRSITLGGTLLENSLVFHVFERKSVDMGDEE